MTDNRTTELLPCPFCGGEASVQTTYGYGVSEAFCLDCGAYTGHPPGGCTEAEAIAAWNARAERTCELVADLEEDGRKRTGLRLVGIHCSECGEQHSGEICFRKDGSHVIYREERDVYCCHCGARITNEQMVVDA